MGFEPTRRVLADLIVFKTILLANLSIHPIKFSVVTEVARTLASPKTCAMHLVELNGHR